MTTLAIVLVVLVAAIHAWILVMEMFLWNTRSVRRAFGTTKAFAKESKVLAANQGLYNGFLAAGLAWSLSAGATTGGRPQAVFFLACVVVAGVFGAMTASRRILLVQALPAALALAAVLAAG